MDHGYLYSKWELSEHKLACSLKPIKRATLKQYLIVSIYPFTSQERFENIIEEYKRKHGVEEYNHELEKYISETGQPKQNFDAILKMEHDYQNGEPKFYSIFDKYDYTPQKTALTLMEGFTSYRQIIVEIFKQSNFPLHLADQEPEKYFVEVDFVDANDISHFQIYYDILGEISDPNVLNSYPIRKIESIKKLPVIGLIDLCKLLKSQPQIQYFPYFLTEEHKIQCANHVQQDFIDGNGHEYQITLHDVGYALLDRNKIPYRCLPIFDLIKPYLEEFDFSKSKDKFLSDTDCGTSIKRFGGSNALKHRYDRENNIIEFQIKGEDRTDQKHYVYIIYNVLIRLVEEEVSINEDHISGEYFCDPPWNDDNEY